MIKNVTGDLFQIGEYVENEYGCEAIQIYVLLNGNRPILIDCGSHIHRQSIMAQLDDLLGDNVPEYIFLTHSELPHAGNIAAVAKKWPEIKVIVSNVMLPYIEVLPVLPLENITQVNPGTVIEFGDRRLEFLDALLKDQPGSQWIFDSGTGTLFCGDGFGYFNAPENNNALSSEVDGGVQVDQFKNYHRLAFRFLEWIKPEKLNADLDRLFTNRPINVIAPIHGSAIDNNVDAHVGRLKKAIAAVHSGYSSDIN